MARCYIYVVDRDFGFAPNPFHGYCTLATCKPGIRKRSVVGDWVVGVGGSRLRATGRCVFAMKVAETLTFNAYWADPRFLDKRPVRNGTQRMVVGDNIYHRPEGSDWIQADSHHSNPDGSPNQYNVSHDTQVDRLLVSDHFFYFGSDAPAIPDRLLEDLGYQNGRNYRVFSASDAAPLIKWLHGEHGRDFSLVRADPFDFDQSARRYSTHTNRVV